MEGGRIDAVVIETVVSSKSEGEGIAEYRNAQVIGVSSLGILLLVSC